MENNEIRLLGYPIKFICPGKAGKQYKINGSLKETIELLKIEAGQTYNGYVVDENLEFPSSRNVYIEVNNHLVSIYEYSIDGIYPITNHITYLQREFSIELLYNLLILMNKKIDDLQEQIYDKADKESDY